MANARAASVDLIYGDSGTGKTSRLGDIAEYYYEKTGKPARLISTDTGGWEVIQPLVNAGVVQPFKLQRTQRKNFLADLQKLTQGHRPLEPDNLACALSPTPETDDISVLLIDGMSSVCAQMHLFHLHAIGIANGQLTPTAVKIAGLSKDNYIEDGDYNRRISSQTDYGEIQRTIRELVNNTASLPIPAVWTALEAKGEDDDKRPVYGPQALGKALTDEIPQWFSNTIHLMVVAVKAKEATPFADTELKHYMFLKKHIRPGDPMKVPYPAQIRVPRSKQNDVPLYADPDMKKFYQWLEKLVAEATPALATASK